MNTSLQWLSDFLATVPTPQAAAEALTHGGLPVEKIEQHGDDTVIDVEVTSNRGDCLSHLGVARELAALLDLKLKSPEIAASESTTPAASAISVAIEAPQLCPHYTARIIRNVRIGPSPQWLTRRLEAIGVRPINNVVDVTNYVLFELGQPLHAFDYDRIAGQRIIVREAKVGEKITSIDNKQRDLAAGMLVIADERRPVALAGVMGGLDSEVSATTTSILLESARFDPLSVRKTARALAMKSDSSYRFERGIDPLLPEHASLRAAQLILQTADGELLGGIVSAGGTGWRPKPLALRLSTLRRVLGVDIPPNDAVAALSRLGLQPTLAGDRIEVQVPSHRLNLNIEVDLVEEVARVLGYHRIPLRDEISIRVTPPEPDAKTINLIRSLLVGSGYFESLTFSFVSDLLAGDFTPPEAAGLLRADPTVRTDDARLRPSILPSLLEAVRRNESNGTPDARLFEIASTFWLDAAGQVVERRRSALVGSADYREVRGAVELLLSRLDRQLELKIVEDRRPGFAAGAGGRIEWGGQAIGHIGRIDRAIADKLSLRHLPAAAELELAALLSGAQHVPQLHALPAFPAARRDLSLVVAESVKYEQIAALIRELSLPHLEELQYVTTYRGKPLDKGQKSVTVELVFRSPTATLTSEQVESSVQQAIGAASRRLGATIRA